MLGTSSFRLMASLYVGMMTTFSLSPISAFTGAFSVKVMISPDVNRAFPFVNMVLPSFLSAVLSAELHGSITSSQFCQVNGWPGRTAIRYGAPLSNGQVNVGCGGTCTGEGGAVILIVARAVPLLFAPISVNTSLPWASPGTTYEPAATALPLSSVRKQLTMLPALFWVCPM